MTKDLQAALKAVANDITDQAAEDPDFDLSGPSASRKGVGSIITPEEIWGTVSADEMAVAEAAREEFEARHRQAETHLWAFDFFLSNDLDPVSPSADPRRAAGFCAGCGAHHVREEGRMLCEECNAAFRDIG